MTIEAAIHGLNRERAVALKKKGLSVEQIAARLGVNKQTVYSHLSNAKKAEAEG